MRCCLRRCFRARRAKRGLRLRPSTSRACLTGALTGRADKPVHLAQEIKLDACDGDAALSQAAVEADAENDLDRSSAYLKKAGAPIIIISSCLWLLSNFGLGSRQPVARRRNKTAAIAPSDLDHSFAAQIGQTMEPALHPMGVDWRVGVGLISAFAAREVFVSTMAIVFHVADDEATQQEGLLENMRAATFADGSRRSSPLRASSGLIIFFFISLQCLSTVSVVRSETGSWRMAGLQLLFYTGLGYLLSSATVQGLRFVWSRVISSEPTAFDTDLVGSKIASKHGDDKAISA